MDRETKVLDEVCGEIERSKRLSDNQKVRLRVVFGRRLENALEALEEGVVKKYVFEPSGRVVWVVVGKERDYQVIPVAKYCSCDDFYFHVIEGIAPLCYHVLAQRLAESLGNFELIVDSDNLYDTLVGEWRFIKKEDFEEAAR